MKLRVWGNVALLVVVWWLITPVYGDGEDTSTDPAFHSAETTEEGSFTEDYSYTEEDPDAAVAIDIPAVGVAPVAVEELVVENPQEHQRMRSFCENAGIAVGVIGGVAALIFCTVGIPALLVTYGPMTTPHVCADICNTNPGYYAPIKNGATPGQYAYVYCNGTTDGTPRKRKVGVPIAAIVAAGSANRRSSTKKPRQMYKGGWICEEGAISPATQTFLQTTLNQDTESTETTLSPLVDMPSTTKAE